MKKTILIQCPLAFCLAAALGFSTLTAADNNLAADYEKSQSDFYRAQDNYARRSDELAAKGEYARAIKMLQEKVVDELKEEINRSDSWIAKRRFAEYSAKLRALRMTYGTIKLREAEKAYAEGRYVDAIKTAVEVKGICDELASEADEIAAAAQSRQTANEYRAKTNPEKMDKDLVTREKQIKQLLAAVRTLMKHGKYEAASVEIEKIYVLDPFNAEAGQLANELYKVYYTTGYKRRQADVAGQLAYEAWQWVEPQFPREVGENKKVDSMAKSADDSGIQNKLNKIIFPKVEFADADLYGVVDFINKRSKVYDTISGSGVIVDIDSNTGGNEEKADNSGENADNGDPEAEAPRTRNNRKSADNAEGSEAGSAANEVRITLEVRNVSLRELLNYICYLTGMTYSVLEDRVVLGTVGVLKSKSYDVSPTLKQLINNFAKGLEADASAEDDSEGEEDGDGKKSKSAGNAADPSEDALKKFFALYGVDFTLGEASINCLGSKITMYNTDINHQRLEALMRELNENKPMVQIEVKSIELSENDMEELGFNWALGTLSNTDLDSKGYYTHRGVATGSNTTYDSASGTTKALSMLSNMLSGVDSRLISNLNIFPDLLGSFNPFGSDEQLNLSLTINALDRSDRTEMISAPRVLVNSGETAEVKMGKGYFFPTDWDELEIEIEDSDGDNGYAFSRTLPTPSFPDEPQLMGTNFKVTPRVLTDNRTIRLDIRPEITSYVGKDEYSMDILVYRNGKLSEDETERNITIWRPVIATRSVDVQVDVYHGETLVLGGLSDSISQSRLDKIPILGDIPFIGRLFQSHSEVSTRRNMLIFVTARLIDSSGTPIWKLQSNFGIPEIGR